MSYIIIRNTSGCLALNLKKSNFPKPILPWAKPTVKGTKAMQRNFVNNVKLCCSIKQIKLKVTLTLK
jgi:hypothetical protein